MPKQILIADDDAIAWTIFEPTLFLLRGGLVRGNVRAVRIDNDLDVAPSGVGIFICIRTDLLSHPQSLITPSTKLMTLFKWRRIGRGVRESNS